MILTPFGFVANPTAPAGDPWQTAAYDYFLTSNWTTTTGDNATGNVSSWEGSKGVMTMTTGTRAVQTGAGASRRAINPIGTTSAVSHPTGAIGVIFAFQRKDTAFMRLINNGSPNNPGMFLLGPADAKVYFDPSSTNGTAGTTLGADIYGWHTLGLKYTADAASIIQVWVDGVALTGPTFQNTSLPKLVRFGDGQYSSWWLGDIAYYQNPSDANMETYGADIATKWRTA